MNGSNGKSEQKVFNIPRESQKQIQETASPISNIKTRMGDLRSRFLNDKAKFEKMKAQFDDVRSQYEKQEAELTDELHRFGSRQEAIIETVAKAIGVPDGAQFDFSAMTFIATVEVKPDLVSKPLVNKEDGDIDVPVPSNDDEPSKDAPAE